MADNIQVSQGTGTTMATDDVSGVQYPRVKVSVGADGTAVDVSSANPMPVADSTGNSALASIDGKLPALVGGKVPVDVGSATLNITGPVTVSNEVEIKNDVGNPIPVSGSVSVSNFPASQAVTGPLTDAQLRATAVPVSGPLTDTQLRASAVPVSGPLTDAELRATPLALPTGAATSANQTAGNSSLASIDTKTPTLISGNQPALMRLEKFDGSIVTGRATESNSFSVGNFFAKFRDGFVTAQPDLAVWDESWTSQGSSFVNAGGNSSGSAYMRISMCPLTVGSEYVLTSKSSFAYPMRFGYGLSASQRVLGQEIGASLVGVDGANIVETTAPIADISISGTVAIASNVATINFASAHGLTGGDRVILVGNAESRLNVGPVVVTVVTATQITVPCTLANGTYTAGGVVRWADPVGYASNAASMVYETTANTTAFFVNRRNGAKYRRTSSTVSTTVATQGNTSSFTDSFLSAGDMELVVNMEEVFYTAKAADALTAPTGGTRVSQSIPDEEKLYKIRFRVKNLDNLTIPVARITAIAKTGTTTATVTTDVNHGLTTNDQIQIYGVRDQTNFPNLTAQTVVASVVSPTQFTVVIGSAVTASSVGGAVWKVQGSTLAPGVVTMAAQSISRTSNVLTVVGSANWSGLLPGEYVHLYGCDATSMGLYDGAYLVLRTSTTSLDLLSVGSDFASINCGGAVIKRTDVRLHYVRMADYTRHAVEIAGARGNIDASRAQAITGAVTVTSGTVTTVSAAALGIPLTVADIASAALTSSTTTTAVTPASGIAYHVNIPVTAVSGTGPTLDVTIQESDDAGTNWFSVYDFPRITATGSYRSPILRLRGNRVRYVQTVGGATPSFTRALNRLQSNNPGSQIVQMIDRTIVPNTLNSTSSVYYCEGCQDFNLIVRCTAQTTAATIDIQVSEDSTNWVTVSGTSVTTVNGVARSSAINVQARFMRAIVSAAGTGITLGELTLKAVGE